MISYKTAFYNTLFILAFYGYIFSSPSHAQVSGDVWEFHPSFSVSERYNDNVRQEDSGDREEDFSVLWRPGLKSEYNTDRYSHILDYSSEFTRYHNLHDEDINTHRVDLTNNLVLGKIIEFTVRTTDRFSSERQDLRQAERRSNFLETNVFTVNPSLRINFFEQTSLVSFYKYSRTSILEKGREDYLSNTFGGSLNQKFVDVVEFFAGYRYIEQAFLEDSPDLVDNVFFGGLNWDIFSSLRLEGEYGFSSREYERETSLVLDSKTENDIWTVTLRNDVTETTHVDVKYSQSPQVREISNTEQILRETVSANIIQVIRDLLDIKLSGSYSEDDYEFTDRRDIISKVDLGLSTKFSKLISFRVGGGYGNNYYWPDAVRENVYHYRVGVNYYPLAWLICAVDYAHREADNDASRDDLESRSFRTEYIQNTVTITLTARF